MVSELSVNSFSVVLGIHFGSTKKLLPFQSSMKRCHHCTFFENPSVRVIVSSQNWTEVLMSFILLRKVLCPVELPLLRMTEDQLRTKVQVLCVSS